MADMNRPTPLRNAARIWSLVSGSVGAVVTFLVTNQVLNAGQAETLTNASASVNLLISAVTGLVAAIGAVAGAFGTAKQGEAHVTPVDNPRDNAGRILAPLAPSVATPGALQDGI